MAKVLLENIQTGMELASDVVDRQGRTLLKSGVELTEKHLRIFNTWGVLEADIKGEIETTDTQKEYPPELVEQADQFVTTHFKHNDLNHPVIKKLAEHMKYHYLESKVT